MPEFRIASHRRFPSCGRSTFRCRDSAEQIGRRSLEDLGQRRKRRCLGTEPITYTLFSWSPFDPVTKHLHLLFHQSFCGLKGRTFNGPEGRKAQMDRFETEDKVLGFYVRSYDP